MWLASADRKRAAWSLSLYEFTAGTKRSGKKARNSGLAAQVGKAFALTKGDEWGGLDAVASDAIVAEEHVQDREFAVKDDADTETPGLELWRASGSEPNIRTAKPLEALVARAAKVGPGFENEHVAFPNRAQLIAHHRPDDPPINSTWVYDPGDGSRDDWRAGLHGPLRVRPWLEKFCAAAPNPRDTASSFEEESPTLALLLNATKSAGDNSGWLGAHFAAAEATLSAEAFGFAHPADDGNHRLGVGFDGTEILEGGLEAYRTKFGSRGSLLYSPLAMSPEQWPFPARSIFPVLTEIREDYTDTHAKLCGHAPGYKKLVTWVPLLDPGPPVPPVPPEDPPNPPTDDPPIKPKWPGIIRVPREGEPEPGIPNVFGGQPASHSGGDDGPTVDDVQGIYPAAGIVPPVNFGERAAAAMNQLEATSMQYRARPSLPDGRLDLRMIGTSEVDNLAGLMYGYTIQQAFESPVVADDVAAPNYLFTAPQNNDDPNQRWPVQLSNAAELSFDDAGGISGRTPARGPGSVFAVPSNVPPDWLFVENKERWTGTPNAMLRAILAGKNAAGVIIPGRGGIGLRNLAGDLVSGWQYELDYTDSATEPNINWTKRDATGANAGAGKFMVNGVELGAGAGTGDITSGSNLTTGRIPKATGVKQIDTPIDLSLGYITVDAADDTVQLLAGPGIGIELRSPTRLRFNVGGVVEMELTPGKMTVPGVIDPTGMALTGVASNPMAGDPLEDYTIWGTAAGRLFYGAEEFAFQSDLPSISGLLVAANNLSDVSSKATSLYNLLNGLGAPLSTLALSTKLGVIEGSTSVYSTFQTLLDSMSGLSASTPALSDVVPFTNSGTAKAATPQKLLDLIHSLTAKTSLTGNDEVALIDSAASNVAKRITWTNVEAQLATDGFYQAGGTDVAVADGGTGASTAAAALTNLGAMPAVNQLASANAADQDSTTTSMAAITGLSGTLEAGAKYRFQIRMRYSTLSLGGFKIDLNGGTATVTTLTYSTEILTTTGTAGSNVIAVNTTALNTALTLANNTTVTDLVCRIEGYIRVNAGGTFIPRFSRTNSAGTARVRDGCSMVLEKCT
jgi:hypothetical protein